MGPPLVICEVSFRSLQGVEHSKHEKPCKSSIDSIVKVTYWLRFFSMPMKKDNASYRGTADLFLIFLVLTFLDKAFIIVDLGVN